MLNKEHKRTSFKAKITKLCNQYSFAPDVKLINNLNTFCTSSYFFGIRCIPTHAHAALIHRQPVMNMQNLRAFISLR